MPWEEEEAAVGSSGVCNRIRGCDGDSCGRGLSGGLGQVEKGWVWGLCSFIILEAALLGSRDPDSSVYPRVPSATNTACPAWCLICGEGLGEAPSTKGGGPHRESRVLKSHPCLLLVVRSQASLLTSMSISSLVKGRHYMKLP